MKSFVNRKTTYLHPVQKRGNYEDMILAPHEARHENTVNEGDTVETFLSVIEQASKAIAGRYHGLMEQLLKLVHVMSPEQRRRWEAIKNPSPAHRADSRIPLNVAVDSNTNGGWKI